MSKLSSAEEAVKQIKDGDTVAFNGFAFGFGFAEEIAKALGKRYEEAVSYTHLDVYKRQ